MLADLVQFITKLLNIEEGLGQQFEFWSYVITIIGLPAALWMYMKDNRKDQEADEEEIYQRLSAQYTKFLELVVQNADLGLLTGTAQIGTFTPEQAERKTALYNILIAVLEEGYIMAYEDKMDRAQRRRWQSWHDFILEWCKKDDFRKQLPTLLVGEDPDFVQYVLKVCNDLGTPITMAQNSNSP